MVKLKCKTKDGILVKDICPFQGSLKKRTQEDIEALKQSLVSEGMIMPFAVWQNDGKNWLLDGHGRLAALLQLATEIENGSDILVKPFPCIYIEAESEQEARKSLLQITSQYGKITANGAKEFMAVIPDYVAPSVKRFVAKPVEKKVTVAGGIPKVDDMLIKIKVPADKAEEVRAMLKQVSYIEVL